MRSFLRSLIVAGILATSGAYAQPILSNGYGYMAAVNGTTYTFTDSIGEVGNYPWVAASSDGLHFYATGNNNGKIYVIDANTYTITDSMNMSGGDISGYNTANTLFQINSSSLHRINTQTKTLTDTIVLGSGNVPNRIEERPNAKEVWVAADSMVYAVDYTSGLSATAIHLSSNRFDNSDLRFSRGGSMAYKSCNSTKKIYKINAMTKVLSDSIDTAPNGYAVVEVSSDSSKVYVASGKTVLIYDAATKAVVDSMVSNKLIMQLYRHPERNELWAVHHFDDSVTVFNEATKVIIAQIPLAPDPFFLAFAKGGPSSVAGLSKSGNGMMAYPNPAHDVLHISFADSKERSVGIYDLSGRQVRSASANGNSIHINIAELAAGTYMISVCEQGLQTSGLMFQKQ